MAPWIVGVLVFVAYPVGASAYYSLTDYDALSEPLWVGLDNYRYMAFDDPFFWRAVRNTLWMVAVLVPAQLCAALVVAVLLNRPRRGRSIYRTLIFLPALAPAVGGTLAFAYLLDPGAGPVNQILARVGIEQPLWFHDPTTAKPGLVLLALWTIGPSIMLLLSGMERVSTELHDMAETEGIGTWQRMRFLTLPMISPVVRFIVVVGIIGAFQYFTESYVLAGLVSNTSTPVLGAPEGSTLFYSVWMYAQGFQGFRLGYASAMAWVLMAVTTLCVAALLRLPSHWAHDEGRPR